MLMEVKESIRSILTCPVWRHVQTSARYLENFLLPMKGMQKLDIITTDLGIRGVGIECPGHSCTGRGLHADRSD